MPEKTTPAVADSLWLVILAGGKGTRLWPLTRRDRPKHLIDIGLGQTLLDATVELALQTVPPERILVIGAVESRAETAAVLHRHGIDRLLCEPAPRDTAAALALAHAAIAQEDATAVIMALSADLCVIGSDAWRDMVAEARDRAREDYLTVVGIPPTRPDPAFGYIKASAKQLGERSYEVETFHEKPSPERARQYVEAGNYLWDSGILLARCDTFLAYLRIYDQSLSQAIDRIVAACHRGQDIPVERWTDLPARAVEHAVIEQASRDGRVAVVQASFAWWDLGTWAGVASFMAEAGRTDARALLHNSQDCYVLPDSSSERRYAVAGLQNVVVVDTGDVILIADRESSADLKKVVVALRSAHWEDLA